MNILFSIIVPIYKVEPYLRECVDSLISQTYSNIEIILVDDGSPDNCPSICDEYVAKDNRIRVIHKQNGGLVSARKAGAEIAHGEYVLCVDGDDCVVLDYVETFASYASRNHPDVILTNGFININSSHSTTIPQCGAKYYNRTDIEKLIFPKLIHEPNASFLAISLCGHAFKRELYTKYQQIVNCNINVGEDIACINPIICHAKSLCLTQHRMYLYRINTESMTHGGRAGSWNDPRLVSEHLKKYTADVNYDFSGAIYRGTAHHIFNVAVSQFYRKEPYASIRKDILSHLNEPDFAEAIKKAEFSGSYKASLMMLALKDQSCLGLSLYAHIKAFKRRLNIIRCRIKTLFSS